MIEIRRLCSLVLVVALLSGLCACGRGSGTTIDYTESAAADTDYIGQGTLEPSPPEPTPTPTPEPEPTDPYDILKMGEDARSYWSSGAGNAYLLRNGTYYSLGSWITEEKAIKYQAGWNKVKDKYGIFTISNLGDDYQISLGDIPIVTIEPDDMIVGDGITSLGLTPATLEGYSISVSTSVTPPYYRLLFPSPNEEIQLNLKSAKQLEMVDSQDNAVPFNYYGGLDDYYSPDFTNLVQGETYTISWFEDTTYFEYKMVANSPYYKIDWTRPPYTIPTYTIEGELHKEGYASFDFSDIQPGLYYLKVYASGLGIFISIPE